MVQSNFGSETQRYNACSRLASVEEERHFNVEYLLLLYVHGCHFFKSVQLLTKKEQKLNMHNRMHNTFIIGKTTSKGPKYILQKPQQQW